jgi:hypothetical protein
MSSANPLPPPPGELDRDLQLGEQRRMVQQPREAVAVHQLAQLPTALGARDDQLEQQ